MVQITHPPDAHGVYRGRVEIFDPATGTWVAKGPLSSFFPDHLTDAQVIGAVEHAYQNGVKYSNNRFRGPSGLGFDIGGYYDETGPTTAYPIPIS